MFFKLILSLIRICRESEQNFDLEKFWCDPQVLGLIDSENPGRTGVGLGSDWVGLG